MFSEFYEKWMAQLEDLLHQLLRAVSSNKPPSEQSGDQLESLVSEVTTHQKQYYAAKWAAAREDVLAIYVPSWLSPLEAAYSWVTGWKPSMAFKLIESLRKKSGSEWVELGGEKARRMGELRARIRVEEEKVEMEMERQQVAMGDRRMVELARLASRRGCSDEDEKRVEAAMKGLKAGLEKVMKAADCLRLKTLKGVLDILSPESKQCVEFLAAAFMLQIQLRKWGRRRKNDYQTETGGAQGLRLS
uniref:DOG1 domain-containing protein n=1 Tax=Kalanchoe fedtschenkoi TaxID=63787 RepID=A0A7N0RDW2_KALFE